MKLINTALITAALAFSGAAVAATCPLSNGTVNGAYIVINDGCQVTAWSYVHNKMVGCNYAPGGTKVKNIKSFTWLNNQNYCKITT